MKMFKTISVITLSLLMQACGSESPTAAESSLSNIENTIQSGNIDLTEESIMSFPLEDLSLEEAEGLAFMREEEKLARDVYLAMYEQYGLRVFNNISNSEQTHMNAIEFLLNKYELEDPVDENGIGTFVNPDLQALFEQLVTTGNLSEIDALKVGAAIEEIDIIDLQKQIDDIADNADIEFVYNNLKSGSDNHLRAFVRNLSVRGITYTPQYLDEDTYYSIVN